jgi:hypothetical protein
MKLSKEQEKFIDENFAKIPDLIELTRATFKDGTIDGRSKQGRAVRAYLASKEIKYKTTKHPEVLPVILSEEQKSFIEQYSQDGMSSFQIAQLLFPDDSVRKLGREQRAVGAYLDAVKKRKREENRAERNKYDGPQNIAECIDRVNLYTDAGLREGEMKAMERKSIESLFRFLKSPRFTQIISNYHKEEDQDLFEAEFIRATWDKPDLSADEINLYVNVCVDYINLKNISSHMEKLNRMFDDADEQQELTVRLSELLKTKSEEYNQCEKRQESLIQRLAGDRAKRISQRQDQNASILSLVESFQNEEERKLMVKMADMQKKVIKEEAENLESMNEWKSRILGISKNDVI